MKSGMRHALLLSGLLVGVVAGLLVVTPSPAVAEGSFDGLAECVDEQRSLSALFLVDTSQSLRDTDPDAARVPALQSAVRALNTLRASASGRAQVTIYLEFLEFGSRTVRSFPDIPEWQVLPSDVEGIADRLSVYASRSNSEDTDYVGALEPWFDRGNPSRSIEEIGAIEMLERAPAGSCQLLVWLTDGALDLDHQTSRKEFNWAPAPVVLRSDRDEAAAEGIAKEVLCDTGGVVDALRLKQAGRLYPPFVATVALETGIGAPPDYTLLRSMALGEADGSTCGDRDANGVFLRAVQLPQLVVQLRRAVLGNPTAEQPEISTCLSSDVSADQTSECEFSFFVAESLTSFNLLMTSSGRGVDVTLIDPTGAELPLRAEGLVQNGVGASLEISRPLDEVFLVDAELPSGSSGWAGEWRVRYSTDDPEVAERIRNSAAIYVVGSLEARLRAGPELIRGREGRFRIELVSSDSNPRGPLAFGEGSRIIVEVDGVELPQPAISPDGSFEYAYDVPSELDADQLAVTVELFPQFVINEQTPPIELDGFSGVVGSLRLKDPPKYPVVEFLTSGDLTVLDVDNPVSVAEVRVDATLTEESGGCVELQRISTFMPDSLKSDGEVPNFEILRDGEPVPEGLPCAIEVASGEIEILELRIEFESEQLRVPAGQVRGELLFRSTSAIDAAETGTFGTEIVAPIEPRYVVATNTGTAVALMLAAVLVPILAMYGVSIFYSARFRLPESAMLVAIPVIYRSGQFYRNDDGEESRLLLRDTDTSLSGFAGGWSRKVELGTFSFSIRPSWSPIGHPVSKVAEANAHFVTSRHGSRGVVGRPGFNLDNVWALAVDSADLVGAGLAGDGSLHKQGQMDPLHGRFMALVPTGPDAARIFAEVVAEVGRRASDSIEAAVQKAAQAAKRREAEVTEPSPDPVAIDEGGPGRPEKDLKLDEDDEKDLPADPRLTSRESSVGSADLPPRRRGFLGGRKRSGRNDPEGYRIEDPELPD